VVIVFEFVKQLLRREVLALRLAESKSMIAPVVKMHRKLAGHHHDDQCQRIELAAALFAEALTEKPRRVPLLKEAASLVDRVPAEMRDLHSVDLWRARIRAGLRGSAAAVGIHRAALRGAG
jgi:hypothetical protein